VARLSIGGDKRGLEEEHEEFRRAGFVIRKSLSRIRKDLMLKESGDKITTSSRHLTSFIGTSSAAALIEEFSLDQLT
jgi:hypothetical protein